MPTKIKKSDAKKYMNLMEHVYSFYATRIDEIKNTIKWLQLVITLLESGRDILQKYEFDDYMEQPDLNRWVQTHSTGVITQQEVEQIPDYTQVLGAFDSELPSLFKQIIGTAVAAKTIQDALNDTNDRSNDNT